MPQFPRAKRIILGIVVFGAVGQTTPAISQVVIQQIQTNTPRTAQGNAPQTMQESDYILGGQAGNTLLNPGVSGPQLPSGSQAITVQVGNKNTANIDMSGNGNIAIQSVFGNRNTVSQQQSGNGNASSVNVSGSGNDISTVQQDVSGASAIINVQGNNNSVTAEQIRNAGPISISRTGNNGTPITVTRK